MNYVIPACAATPSASALQTRRPVLSVVVPCHNEQEALAELHARLSAVLNALGQPAEIIFVNDGSSDATLPVLQSLRGARCDGWGWSICPAISARRSLPRPG